MLVRSGVPVLKALGMCRELLLRATRVGLDRALGAATAGAPLAAALHEQGIVDALGLRVLARVEQPASSTARPHVRRHPRPGSSSAPSSAPGA